MPPLLAQWPAVSTHSGATTVPEHWNPMPSQSTCAAHGALVASVPPMMFGSVSARTERCAPASTSAGGPVSGRAWLGVCVLARAVTWRAVTGVR